MTRDRAPLRHAWLPFLALLTAPLAHAGDWPQLRGPHRDGVSRERDWESAGAEAPLWSHALGLGYSSVAVVDGRLYTLGYDADVEQDVLWCLDAESGEVLWTHTWPAKIWNELHGGGTLTTPSVEGGHVWVLNREGRFLRLAAADGEVEWERDLTEELGVTPPKWGFSASPLLLEEALVLNVGKVVALDKQSGETRWITEQDSGAAYSTPVDMTLGEERCLAVFNGGGLVLLDRGGGTELFRREWKTRFDINAATPVVAGERLFVSSGLGRGGALLAFGAEGVETVWESKVIGTKMSGCVLVDGHLYGFDDSVLKCVDLEGNERWRERGLGDGCLIAAGERLLIQTGDGELLVAEASPEELVERSRAKVLDGGKCWTTPVLANGLVYCRSSEGQLVCRDHRGR